MSNSKAIAPIALDPGFDPKRRALVIVGLIVVTAFSFWFFSRYPDLDRKAQMAEAV